MMIENDQNFFSPMISQESPIKQTTTAYNNGDTKYQCQDMESPSMQINIPPKVNNGKLWTSGQSDEEKRTKKYYMKLIILAILMVLFLTLIIFSAIMYKSVKAQDNKLSTSSRHKGGTTNKYKTSSPQTSSSLISTRNNRILSTVKPSLSSFVVKSPSKIITIPFKTDTDIKSDAATMTPPTPIESTANTESTDTLGMATSLIVVTDKIDKDIETTDFLTGPMVTTDTEGIIDSVTADLDTLTDETIEIVTTNAILSSPDIPTELPFVIPSRGAIVTDEIGMEDVETTDFITDPMVTTDTKGTTDSLTADLDTLTDETIEVVTTNAIPSSPDLPTTPTELPFLIPSRGATIPSSPTPFVSSKSTFTTTLFGATYPLPSLPPGCQEIPVDACRQALHPLRGTTMTSNLPDIYALYSTTVPGFPACHNDAIKTVCSLNTIPCDGNEPIYPCRSTCLHVASACFKDQNPGMYDFWLDEFCSRLPESTHEEICFKVSSNDGTTDDVTTNSCNSSYCLNNGQCFDINGEPFCRCSSTAGRRCGIGFDFTSDGGQEPVIQGEKCKPIPDDQCLQALPYNQTRELIVSGLPVRPPWELVAPAAACHDKAALMFCGELNPEGDCRPQDRSPYAVCDNLCFEVRDQCQFFYAALKFTLYCDAYPNYAKAAPGLLCM